MQVFTVASLFVLASIAPAQTISRTYSVTLNEAEFFAGSTPSVEQNFVAVGPDVTDGPFVATTSYGGTFEASRRYEADYVNNTSTPKVMDLGFVEQNAFFVIGSDSGCGTGFDGCINNCASPAGFVTVAPNSTHTEVWTDSLGPQTFSSTQTCIFGATAVAIYRFRHTFVDDASEFRWSSELQTIMFRAVDLFLNPNVTKLCTTGVPNSTGARATLDWYGSLESGTRTATVVANDLPPRRPAVCIITAGHDPMPPGLGTVPVSCLNGFRLFQFVQWSDDSGQVEFDLDLALASPGFTHYTQVIFREEPAFGGFNSTELLAGTAE